jgi:xyloglucan:xyloglucosyl transferase
MASVRALLLSCLSALALANIVASSAPVTAGERITDKLEILWGQTQLLNGDRTLALSLDRAMGSGFRSKTSYLFARIDIDIKLVPKNSAGTVTTVYVSGPATLTIMRVNNVCIVWFGAVDF